MFETKNNGLFELEEEDFDTVLATDISFTGEVYFEEPLMIKGKVSGKIEATSDLVIAAGAVVTKSFPDGNCVIAGNPAKKIKDL